MAIDLDNPLNRLTRCLGRLAEDLAEKLGITPRHMQTLSQNHRDKAMRQIEENFPFSFVKEYPGIDLPELSGQEKQSFCTNLLGKDRSLKQDDRNLFLRESATTEIRPAHRDAHQLRYFVRDLKPGTPTTISGHLLTHEFSKLLNVRKEWHSFLAELSRGSELPFDKAYAACLKKYPGGFSKPLFDAAYAEECRRISDRNYATAVHVLLPFTEYFLIRSLFSELKKLYAVQGNPNQDQLRRFTRLKSWLMIEYNLNELLFKQVLKEGEIQLLYDYTVHDKKAEIQKPEPENFRVALVFVDEVMTALLKGARRGKGKK